MDLLLSYQVQNRASYHWAVDCHRNARWRKARRSTSTPKSHGSLLTESYVLVSGYLMVGLLLLTYSQQNCIAASISFFRPALGILVLYFQVWGESATSHQYQSLESFRLWYPMFPGGSGMRIRSKPQLRMTHVIFVTFHFIPWLNTL